MSKHEMTVTWKLGDSNFDYHRYPRAHQWSFSHGVNIAASAAPEFHGDAHLVDPEQAFVAAISSCHMLTFLAIASRKRIKVLSYEDHAVGWLDKNADGHMSVTRVELNPKIKFDKPSSVDQAVDRATVQKMHDRAHRECFIANSVNTEILVNF